MNVKINFQNKSLKRNYLDKIGKNNYSLSNFEHLKYISFACKTPRNDIYKRKILNITAQKSNRNSILNNNSEFNILAKDNKLNDNYSNLNDSVYTFAHDNNYFVKISPKIKSERKENNYGKKIKLDYNPNLNLKNEKESNDYIRACHSLEYKNNSKLNEVIEQNNKLQNEMSKLKISFEEYKNKEKEKDLNQVKEKYNNLKKEYDLLKEAYSLLENKYNKIKNSNEKLNSERIEINKNIDEIYNSQYQNNENYDIVLTRIDSLEEENKNLKNKLKMKSSFLQNEKIEHFKLCFISEITKKGEDNIKIKKCYHTPEKINNKLIEIKNKDESNKNYKKLKDDYNELNEKYNYLKNEYKKVLNDFNIMKKQENTNNQNGNNSFCIINHIPENIPDIPNLVFNDINQNEEPKNLLRKSKINSICSNSIIQCLTHVNKLVHYFLNDYRKNYLKIKRKNKNIIVSDAFHSLIQDIFKNKDKFSFTNSVSLKTFKDKICVKKPQIFDLNCGDFLLNLLQIFHEELNYLGNKITPNLKSFNSFKDFNKEYKMNNSSIISDLFFGTYEYKKQCKMCKNIVLDFKKFNFLSFGISKQYEKVFSIYNGFEENEKAQTSSFSCDHCNKYCEFEKNVKIVEPPKLLLININYSRFKTSKFDFDKKIDITKFVSPSFEESKEYKINCICSKTETKYLTYCWNIDNEKWYIFDNSSFKECEEKDIYLGYPYLLLYERL